MDRIEAEHGSYTVSPDVLSKGGVGSIHRTSDPRWVFKRYLRPDKAPDLRHLRRLVEIGREVLVRPAAKLGQTPESSVNWPVDMAIARDGSVTGVVLPAIPGALFNEFGKPRGLEFLIMARAHPPNAKGRVALLLRMAEILAFVNARGLVHGDVNGKNLVWTVSPDPVMYLIDCDGMVPHDPPPAVGVQAMGWTDPRVLDGVVPAHDRYSDWYALALAMYRGLLLTPGKLDTKTADGTWPAPSKVPGSLGPRIANLLHRALDDPLKADGRPPPEEWADAIIEEYLPGGRFRESALAALDKVSTARQARTAFTALPDADWTGTHGTPRTSPRTPRSTPVPPPPPPVRSAPPPPPPAWRAPATRSYATGKLGQRALDRGAAWHVLGLAASVYMPYVALPYVIVSWYQLRNVSSFDPRRRPARTALMIYGAIAGIVLMIFLIAAVSSVLSST
jgi:hypothetical protein